MLCLKFFCGSHCACPFLKPRYWTMSLILLQEQLPPYLCRYYSCPIELLQQQPHCIEMIYFYVFPTSSRYMFILVSPVPSIACGTWMNSINVCWLLSHFWEGSVIPELSVHLSQFCFLENSQVEQILTPIHSHSIFWSGLEHTYSLICTHMHTHVLYDIFYNNTYMPFC